MNMTNKKRHGNCKDFVDWDTARHIVREERIGSRREYHNWIRLYQPPLPYSPYHNYPQWKSWNDYLGVDTPFPTSRFFLPYKQAWDYARKCPARTLKEWISLYNANQIRKDIPARPDCYYRGQFTGWRSFLGVSMKPSDAILQSQLDKSPQPATQPAAQSTPFYVGYDSQTQMFMMAWNKSMLGTCSGIRAWMIDDRTLLSDIQGRHCQHQGGGEYLIGNVHEFLFDMDTTFLPYKLD